MNISTFGRVCGATAILVSSGFSFNAIGHGLMVEPASRNALCGLQEKPDQATSQHCIDAFAQDFNGGYQFMSVLTHDVGRKGVTPLPEHVCGFGSETWQGGATPWDTPTNWPTTSVVPGGFDIVWNISWGPHFDDTEEFRYWITKSDFVFDPTQALSWSDFEEEAFCVALYDDTNPTGNPNVLADKAATTFTTSCQLPERSGHHVVYGEWGRNFFTFERFHGCLDLAFGDASPSAPTAQSLSVVTTEATALPITLDGRDVDGQVVEYRITDSVNNGQLSGSGANVVYQPSLGFSGADEFNYLVVDNDGLLSAEATVSITVTSSNQPPIADFTSSIDGLNASFDASVSSDPEGAELSFSWDFGDGNGASGEQVQHSYASEGNYNISLVVSDGLSETTASDSVQVGSTTPGGIACDYVVNNEWNAGFVATVRLTNTGTEAISDWQVSWYYPEGVSRSSGWNAEVTGENPYTASPVDWNSTIFPGQTVEFGIQGAKPNGQTAPVVELSGPLCD